MSRGESQKPVTQSGAIGVWAVFAAIAVGVIVGLLLITRACAPDPAEVVGTEPFPGATQTIAGLDWRDCTIGPDAERELAQRLRDRGYRSLDGSRTVELPLSTGVPELADACGVVAFVGAPGAALGPVGVVGQPSRPPCGGSNVTTIGVCGDTPIHLDGLGQAVLRAWAFDDLTPDDVSATEIDAESLLALAEGEILLAREGWTPSDRALLVEPPGRTTTWEPPVPGDGCVMWLIAGRGMAAMGTSWNSVGLAWTRSDQRSLAGAPTCADAPTSAQVTFDRTGSEVAFYARPFTRNSEGPRLPEAERARSRARELRAVTDPTDLDLP
ncbi:MAG: hypothetical protein AB7S26_33015 [Sandaracinaceae bacterium]